MDKKKTQRYFIQLVIGLLVALFTSFWVNLFTSALTNRNWIDAILILKWSHSFLGLSILLIISQVILIRFWNRADKIKNHALSEKYVSLEIEMIQSILKLAVVGIRALRKTAKINARYYYPSTIDSQKALVKQRKIHVETIYMPGEYGLDYAIIDED